MLSYCLFRKLLLTVILLKKSPNSCIHKIFFLYTFPFKFSAAVHHTLFSLTKNKWDLLFNTSPNQKQTQEVTAVSPALTQLWLTTPTKNSQFSCISLLHTQLLYKTIMWLCCFKKDRQLDFLFSTFSNVLARELRPTTWSEGGCKLFMKNLPNSTKTLGNLKTADYFELNAFLKLSHKQFYKKRKEKEKIVHILSSATYK